MKKNKCIPFYDNYDDVIKLNKPKVPILVQRSKYLNLKNNHVELTEELGNILSGLNKIKNYDQYFISEELEFSDIALAIVFGACGSFITNNEKLKMFLEPLHNSKYLDHKNNPIDYNESYEAINRNGGKAKFGFHRLFYGHDILSFKGDNPFQLYARKFGFLKGFEKAIKHLFADSCSKQGIPLPGSSLFDVGDGKDFTNLIYEICKKVGKGASEKVHTAYQNLFTYHLQDSIGTDTSDILSNIYLKARGFETEKAKNIFKIIKNISEFIVNAIVGLIKTKGLAPKINWRNIVGLLYQLGHFIGIKIKERKIKKIEDKYNWQVLLIENCRNNIYRIYKKNYIIDSILILLLLPITLLLFIKFIGFNGHLIPSYPHLLKSNASKNSIIDNQDVILPESKSFEFRPDRRDYVDNDVAKQWCDEIAGIIKNMINENSNLRFLITGYVAVFNNEIDADVLALERAEKIKFELIKRGIRKDILDIRSGGSTERWGKERKFNRAVTIESVK